MDLQQCLQQYDTARFQYGTLDCCLFVAEVVQALTGIDYATPWRGRYSSEFGALRMVKEHGDLQGIACAAFGSMQPMRTAQPGNPVLLTNPLIVEHDAIAAALGVCTETGIVYLTECGLQSAPRIFGRGCWHV